MYSHEKAQRQLLPLTAEQEANPKVKSRTKGGVLGVDIVACRLEGRWTYFVIHHLPKTNNAWMDVCLLIIIIRNHHYDQTKPNQKQEFGVLENFRLRVLPVLGAWRAGTVRAHRTSPYNE